MREGLLGWATDMLIELDDKAPGVLSRVLTAAPARRQAIFSPSLLTSKIAEIASARG